MLTHEVDELLDGVIIRASTNIKHQAVFGLQVLADALEEPLVRVDLTIISVLDAEHEIDSTTSQVVSLDTEVPSRDLETVQKIAGNLIRINALVHDITHVAHLKVLVTIQLHETFLEEDFFIEEAFLASQRLHADRNIVVSISDHDHQEIILRKALVYRVCLQAVVIVKTASQSCLELFYLLIIHSNADSQLRIFFSNTAPCTNL